MTSKPFIAGRLAFHDGKLPVDNPNRTPRGRAAWIDGYQTAAAEAQRQASREVNATEQSRRVATRLREWANTHL